jgi:hypothetical protein
MVTPNTRNQSHSRRKELVNRTKTKVPRLIRMLEALKGLRKVANGACSKPDGDSHRRTPELPQLSRRR